MDLFGPVNIQSISKKRYTLVIVDDFTRFTWVYFIAKKDAVPQLIFEHIAKIEKNSIFTVKVLRSDNGTEFKNAIVEDYCAERGITQQFTAPGTPQQNGVVERKNRTLIEAARTMLIDAKLPTYFWAEAIQTACFVHNCTLVNMHGKTPYEMVKGKKPNVKYFHTFGCKCFVLKQHPEQLGKFEPKSDEAIFLGYSTSAKAFRVYNLSTLTVMESIHVKFDDNKIQGLDGDHEQLAFENKPDTEIDEEDSDEDSAYVPPQEPIQKNTQVEGEQIQIEENSADTEPSVTIQADI